MSRREEIALRYLIVGTLAAFWVSVFYFAFKIFGWKRKGRGKYGAGERVVDVFGGDYDRGADYFGGAVSLVF